MWRAFFVVMVFVSALNVLVQWLLNGAFGLPSLHGGVEDRINAFFGLGGEWGTAVLVYVNRRCAQRLLDRLRAAELERAEAERRLVASRLAAVEAQIDPAVVLRQLVDARNLYAAAAAGADEQLETLISGLRASLARTASTQLSELRA